MKEYALVPALALSLLSPQLFATEADKQFYIGANLGVGSGEETISIDGDEEDYDTDISTMRLAVGFIVDENIRIEASYGGYDLEFDDFEDSEITTFEFDGYLLFPADGVTPYVTAGLGLATYEDTGDVLEGDDLSGVSLQLGAGISMPVSEVVELDASYRIKVIGWETVEVFDTEIETSHSMGLFTVGGRVLF
ncbi:porin family protein [Thalassolituus sp. UBA3500]|uniref:porin family protein n=1 Tax=Thalassolituus sp. UBA3500 TaxID=1947664 RepID=UPI00263B49A5|nr:porin family protein [Thalassolituus sp. UBA3500]|tara:strand:- start:100 stop:678 length:579 start_codon:yes stop_codon:yes gene_type:complete